MAEYYDIFFGVEFEWPLRPAEPMTEELSNLLEKIELQRRESAEDTHNKGRLYLENWNFTANPLISALREKGLTCFNKMVEGDDYDKDYTQWALMEDDTIEGKAIPVELRSPKFRYTEVKDPTGSEQRPLWEGQVRNVWDVVKNRLAMHGEYEPDWWVTCSTNVHFSLQPTTGPLKDPQTPINQARLIAFAAIYMEPAIDDLMVGLSDYGPQKWQHRPGGWKNCDEFAAKNRVVVSWNEDRTVRRCLSYMTMIWDKLKSQEDIKALNNLVCFDQREPGDSQMKYYKWNFRGVGFNTIEFRQMHPVMEEQAAEDWIRFTIAFARAAMALHSKDLDRAVDAYNGSPTGRRKKGEGDDAGTYVFDKKVPNPALAQKHASGREEIEQTRQVFCEAFGLNGTPSTVGDLKSFLRYQQLDGEFWSRMEARRDKFDAFLKNPPPRE